VNIQKKKESKVPIYPISIAAERSGYDARQIIYRIRTGKVKAKKMGWLWYLTDEQIEKLKKMKEEDN